MADWILEPFSHGFMQRAWLGTACCVVACACIGAHLVARRMTFVGSALTHTLLPGVVGAWLLGLSPHLGAVVSALGTAALIALAGGRRESGEDAAVGVAQSALFALGILLMAQAQSWRDFTGLLFGTALGISPGEVAMMAGLAAAVIGALVLGHRALEASALDEDYARLAGLRPALLRLALVALAGLAAAGAVRLLGAMLTAALLIVPAAAGLLLARSLAGAMAWAAGLALLGCTAGLLASYHLANLPSGAAMVMGCCVAFAGARLWRGRRG